MKKYVTFAIENSREYPIYSEYADTDYFQYIEKE